MATLVARQKGKSSPQSENRGSSESSKSASSRDKGSGFQRGFLLSSRNSKKATKGSSRGISRGQTLTDGSTITGTKSSVSPSASALQQLVGPTTSAAAADDQKQECSSTKTAKAQTALVERAAEKKDSGWAKGFLTNESKKEKRTTTATATVSAVGVTQSKGSNARKSKARSSVATPSKKKDLGWSKGFLTNTNINNRKKETKIENETKRNLLDDTNRDSKIERQRKEQTSPKGNYPKAVRRSCSLLSIDDNDNDGYRCSKNAAQIIAPANTSPKTVLTTRPGDTKPLISVVFEESSNDTTKSPDSPQQLDQDSTVEINKRRRNSNVEGATTMFATKSLITPLISIVGEKEDGEEKSSSIFFKEVSTTRKSNHGRSEIAELMGVPEEERCYSPDEGHSVSMENMKDEKKEELSGATFNNDNDSNSNILKFQQELERLFSRPLKGSDDKDELQTIRMRFKTPEHRRYAWTYVLQQRQQQQVRQKRRIENVRETNECDGRIRELFDAEYFHHRQQQHEITINDYGNNDEAESPLESILRCVETDEERRMSLQAVLLILEYFSFRYKEQEQHPKHKIPLRSSKNSILANVQAERIRRLMPLVVQLTRLSSSDRRTRLVQISWETAILLVSFCIREFLRVVPPSSSLFDNSSSTLSVTFWDQLDLLLHHQLIWQQSKTKSNAVKINHLKEVRTKSIFFLKDRNPQQKERLGVSMESLLELVIDLEKLMNL
jgi:hypothetical protein